MTTTFFTTHVPAKKSVPTPPCGTDGKKKKPVERTEMVHEAEGATMDMLSSFYYMRHIDYPSMKPGESVTTNIFSGTKKETLKITYHGLKDVEVNDRKYSCYYIIYFGCLWALLDTFILFLGLTY